MKDFYDIREIGAGSYGKVKLVELHENLYAVKQVSQDLIQRYEKVANVYFERDVMQASNSLSIPQFYFAFRDKTKLRFVMEYVRNGTLYDHLCKGRGMPLGLIRHYGAQMINFLEYIHAGLEICHRDLKPGNIMLDDNLYLKIIDFGDAKALYNCENFGAPFFTKAVRTAKTQEPKRKNTFVGTPLYVSPEMLDQTASGAFTDLWTLGVILYEMACGVTPF
jgi:3-phosphoinositide dependent protein kinase-1